jgi:hypothetical protein
MKGYSLPNKPMRDMHDHILEECNNRGIDVFVAVFMDSGLNLRHEIKMTAHLHCFNFNEMFMTLHAEGKELES